MPYASDAQRKFMHAEHPEIAAKWDKEYADADIGGDEVDVIAPNGQAGTIPRENLTAALAAGFTQAAAPTATNLPNVQDVVKPEDIGPNGTYNIVLPSGEHGTIPTAALPEALKAGAQLKSEHAKAADYKGRVERYKKDLTTGAAGGHVETGLRGYADEFLAGGANKLEKYIGQSAEEAANPEVQLENKAYEEAQNQVNEEQSGTYKTGEVAGWLGQTYLGSRLAGAAAPGVAGALESAGLKSAVSPILSAAANEAIGGAITMSPQALAQAAINKDPAAATESLLIGLGTGAVIGTALKGLSKFYSGSADAIEAAGPGVAEPAVKNAPFNTTEKLLLEHLGLTSGMRKNIGDFDDQRRILTLVAKELGGGDVEAGTKQMVRLNREDLAMQIKKLTDENGPKIGNIRKELDKAITDWQKKGFGDEQDILPKIVARGTEDEVKNSLLGKIAALKEGLVSPEEVKVVDHAFKFLQDNKFVTGADGASFRNFTEADKVKSYFQDRVDWTAKGAEKAPNRVAAKIAAIVRQSVEESAEKIAIETGNPKLIENWANYKALYGVGKTLDAAADRTLNAAITHEFIPGGHGTLGAGMLGHVVGHAVGLPVIGPILGVVGAKGLKHYLREGGIARAAYWLGGRIKDPAVHSYMTIDAMRANADKIESIPQIVKSMAVAGTAKAIMKKPDDPVVHAMKNALGEEADGLSEEEQFKKLADKIGFMQGNKEALNEHIASIIEGVAQNHPDLAQNLSLDMQKKLEYISSILPKNPNQPMPFQHDPEWKPTPSQLYDFKKQLAVANDPFHALKELEDGTLTAQQVAAMAVINPDMLTKMRGELIKLAMNKNNKLTYQQRLSMGIMLGEKIDQQLMAVPNLPPMGGAAPAQPAAGKGKKSGGTKVIKPGSMPDYRTQFQKSLDKND